MKALLNFIDRGWGLATSALQIKKIMIAVTLYVNCMLWCATSDRIILFMGHYIVSA